MATKIYGFYTHRERERAPVAVGICRFVFAEQVLKTPEEKGKQMAKTNSNSAAAAAASVYIFYGL